MNREECSERIRLIDEYSRLITAFNDRLELLKGGSHERDEEVWLAVEKARTESQIAWEAIENHIAEHRCIPLRHDPNADKAGGTGAGIMEKAAMVALDPIFIVDDERRCVDVNEAAAEILRLPRREVLGRRLDEIFSKRGETFTDCWDGFVAEGVSSGICELVAPGPRRQFEYRARANFAPGLHLSILREVNNEDC